MMESILLLKKSLQGTNLWSRNWTGEPIIGLVAVIIFPSFAYAENYEVEVVAESLDIPWSIGFSPDGRIFVTERGGNLRIIEDGKTLDPIAKFDVGGGEGGLLGVALDPSFSENHYIYLYYTHGNIVFTKNKVVRFTVEDNSLKDEMVLLDDIPASVIHDGGRLRFGPDGKLYVTTGDAGNRSLSQNPDSLAGKILRINPDGTIPDDNPFPNSPVYSLGHRNPQGIDWDPNTGTLVEVEHGPSGEKGFAHDEINIILAGKNYGWPEIVGEQKDSRYQSPLSHSGDETWAPSGASFYTGDNPELNGKFLVATLRGNHLKILDIDFEEEKIISEKRILEDYGRLRDVAIGPDQNIYVLTSNRDGRGSPSSNDDRILRVLVDSKETPPTEYENLPPLDQIKNKVKPSQVVCKDGFALVIKYNGNSAACFKVQNVSKIIERGWGYT